MLEMQVSWLGVESNSSAPVVILKEVNGERVLPIWIGSAEAYAIAVGLHGLKVERPLTHDLLKATIDGLRARVMKVVISDLRENTYYAKVYLDRGGSTVCIDARPSDSIALALRAQVPIFVSNDIMGLEPSDKPDDRVTEETLGEHLRKMNPEEFGKFRPDQ